MFVWFCRLARVRATPGSRPRSVFASSLPYTASRWLMVEQLSPQDRADPGRRICSWRAMLVGTALLTVPRMGAVRRKSIQPARTRRTVAPKERPAIASMSPIFGAIALARNAIGRRRPVSERCLRLLQPMPPKPAEKPFDTALIDVVLDTLLQRNPPPQIVAINEMGFFVPMPPAMPAQVGRLFNGRTSACHCF